MFLFTDKPLPETSQVHMLVTVPGKPQPLSLVGKVSHTILAAGRGAARAWASCSTSTTRSASSCVDVINELEALLARRPAADEHRRMTCRELRMPWMAP